MLYGYTPFDDENAKNVFFNVLTSKISFSKILAADDAVDIGEDARSLISNPDPARHNVSKLKTRLVCWNRLGGRNQ